MIVTWKITMNPRGLRIPILSLYLAKMMSCKYFKNEVIKPLTFCG